MKNVTLSENLRRDLVSQQVTLNGKPAGISGVKCEFAVVRSLDGTLKAEWAWSTVAAICALGGSFKM